MECCRYNTRRFQAIGYALLVLFFVVGVVKTCGSFADVRHNKEHYIETHLLAFAKECVYVEYFSFREW